MPRVIPKPNRISMTQLTYQIFTKKISQYRIFQYNLHIIEQPPILLPIKCKQRNWLSHPHLAQTNFLHIATLTWPNLQAHLMSKDLFLQAKKPSPNPPSWLCMLVLAMYNFFWVQKV